MGTQSLYINLCPKQFCMMESPDLCAGLGCSLERVSMGALTMLLTYTNARIYYPNGKSLNV